ncbi:double zinc ribbon domain-containing protein [Natronobacterium texcoconense]|uniref:DZANK-type domain-containing protein n=1 Tax=Natronobacterium texcoconense TaxID=1095778 RepID=A0A1H1H0E4_NATTX|nr:zinc ribbon domain-containing protein [Natronobacterium texcoconense]SDR18849.1 hypothetical protein SAMN04489842_2716 [Natronobacterium texcoconense]
MSKITFRADDELVDALESLELSKSEAMRQALRAYIDEGPDRERETGGSSTSVDDVVRERVDELLEERLREERRRGHAPAYDDHPRSRAHTRAQQPQDVNVSISLEGGQLQADEQDSEPERARDTTQTERPDVTHRSQPEPNACGQCGEHVADDHVYCPNCGEKASRRLFCDCGDELRSDWAFCPSCGRRTPSADVLEPNSARDGQS